MRGSFDALSKGLFADLTGDEVLLAGFSGEDSDFVRMNNARVRQPGSVAQQELGLDLIVGQRHAEGRIGLSGRPDEDLVRARHLLGVLRERVPVLPEDPHLLYATDVNNTEDVDSAALPDAADAIDSVLAAADGTDFVGIWASGAVHRGFANSLGQTNWFTSNSFHLDWSLYAHGDKAVKSSYAGRDWSEDAFLGVMDRARQQLSAVSRPARTIDPGSYRVFLAPAALAEIVELLAWGGFSLKAQRTRRSCLMEAVEGKKQLNRKFTLRENTADGFAPGFEGSGFVKPASVTLFEGGEYKDALISARSAKEYGVPTNGAGGDESPNSFDLAAGDLPLDEALSALGTGILVNNLWYLNYSDRPSCRMTGMTRFATFWVEDGELIAPLNVMRFDDTAYRILGENLVDLTRERDLILDASTYERRSTGSLRLPGALVQDFRLTL
jgi:predicted Zn-dependent protease